MLIFDLDETLIHSSKENPARDPDFKVFEFNVMKRPYLYEFLIECKKEFKLAIWSTGSEVYVDSILK